MFDKLANKDIDLLQAYNRKSGPSPHETLLKAVLPPLCIVLVYTGIFAWQKVDTLANNRNISSLNKEIDKYQKKISDLGEKEYNEYLSYQSKNTEILDTIHALDSYPVLSSTPINAFSNVLSNGMSITTISYEKETFTVSLSTKNVLDIEEYVRALRSSDVFATVEYKGYQQNESTVSTGSSNTSSKDKEASVTVKTYVFSVVCKLKGGN